MNRDQRLQMCLKVFLLAIVMFFVYWAGEELGKRQTHRKIIAAWNSLFQPPNGPAPASNITGAYQPPPNIPTADGFSAESPFDDASGEFGEFAPFAE